jgi:hypothetical protein
MAAAPFAVPTELQSPEESPHRGSVRSNAGVDAAVAEGSPELSPDAPLPFSIPQDCQTLVVRNVPIYWKQEQLLMMWPPAGSWNLLYFPFILAQHRRSGYVFINFVSRQALLLFVRRWHDKVLLPEMFAKRLEIFIANTQGFEANLEGFRRSRKLRTTKDNEYLPVVLNPDGSRRDFRQVMADACIANEETG